MFDDLKIHSAGNRSLRIGMLLSLAVLFAAAAGIANSVLHSQSEEIAVAPKERALS